MADLRESVREQRNAVERIAQRIPGFQGYYDRENRRQADKALRDFGVKQLEEVIRELRGATRRAPLEEMDDFRVLVTQLERLRNELRFADQGYSGFFSEFKGDREEVLDAVYELDLRIVETVAALAADVVSEGYTLEHVHEEILVLQRALLDRQESILGLGER